MNITRKQLILLLKEAGIISNFSDDFEPDDVKRGYTKYKKKFIELPKNKAMMNYFDTLYGFYIGDWHVNADKKIYFEVYNPITYQKHETKFAWITAEIRQKTIEAHPEFNLILQEVNKVWNHCYNNYYLYKDRYGWQDKYDMCQVAALELVVKPWLEKIKKERTQQWVEDNIPESARLHFKIRRERGISDDYDDIEAETKRIKQQKDIDYHRRQIQSSNANAILDSLKTIKKKR